MRTSIIADGGALYTPSRPAVPQKSHTAAVQRVLVPTRCLCERGRRQRASVIAAARFLLDPSGFWCCREPTTDPHKTILCGLQRFRSIPWQFSWGLGAAQTAHTQTPYRVL